MRIASLLPSFGVVLLALPFVALGCNAKVATILESDEAGAGPGTTGDPSSDAGTTTMADSSAGAVACSSKGGKCLPIGDVPQSPHRKADPTEATCAGTDVCWIPTATNPTSPVCSNDAGCNDDPSVSSLWGSCFGGLCICNSGYTVQPNGKCGKLPAPECQTQPSGKCYQQPATCPAAMFESTNETNASCGDLIAAVCCFPEATCKGPSVEVAGGGRTPIEMVCCAPNDASSPPLCVNGWQTCAPGGTAVDKKLGCF